MRQFVDALCECQAAAIVNDPALVGRARTEMACHEDTWTFREEWMALLDAGPDACVEVLTSTRDDDRPLKADSPFAYVVDLTEVLHENLRKDINGDPDAGNEFDHTDGE